MQILITASGNALPERHSVFDTYTGNSCRLFFCSDPCKPPVCLPPDSGLASVQERRSSVPEHDMRSPRGTASPPAGIWLLHPAPAVSAVHSPSGRPAALGMCEGLKRPRSLGRRWTLRSQLFPLSHMASGLRTTQRGPKRTFYDYFFLTSQLDISSLYFVLLPQTPPNLSKITFFTGRFALFGFATCRTFKILKSLGAWTFSGTQGNIFNMK